MRYFFGYLANGGLTSVESYTPGGWPDCDCSPGCTGLSNPDCGNALCISLRAGRAQHRPDIVGYVDYNCPCPTDLAQCAGHVEAVYASHYVVDGELVEKAETTHFLDGEPLTVSDQTILKVPETTIAYKIASPGIPDGSKAYCFQGNATRVAPEENWEMTFTDGETEEKTLIAPAQGSNGEVRVAGPLINGIRFNILGWAAG